MFPPIPLTAFLPLAQRAHRAFWRDKPSRFAIGAEPLRVVKLDPVAAKLGKLLNAKVALRWRDRPQLFRSGQSR
jgi:hypothetical protein